MDEYIRRENKAINQFADECQVTYIPECSNCPLYPVKEKACKDLTSTGCRRRVIFLMEALERKFNE